MIGMVKLLQCPFLWIGIWGTVFANALLCKIDYYDIISRLIFSFLTSILSLDCLALHTWNSVFAGIKSLHRLRSKSVVFHLILSLTCGLHSKYRDYLTLNTLLGQYNTQYTLLKLNLECLNKRSFHSHGITGITPKAFLLARLSDRYIILFHAFCKYILICIHLTPRVITQLFPSSGTNISVY